MLPGATGALVATDILDGVVGGVRVLVTFVTINHKIIVSRDVTHPSKLLSWRTRARQLGTRHALDRFRTPDMKGFNHSRKE
jgi:hypothetical protein